MSFWKYAKWLLAPITSLTSYARKKEQESKYQRMREYYERQGMDASQIDEAIQSGTGFDAIESMLGNASDKYLGTGLTQSEKEANAFSAEEAQKGRDWEEYMSNTAYQRQVADMKAAGVNPAMAMSNGAGGASTPGGSTASSVSPGSGMSMSELLSIIMLPLQKSLVKAQTQQAKDAGEAALINARANAQNAGTNEQNAATERMRADTDRMRAEIERSRVENINALNDAEKGRVAAQTAFINLQREMLPRQINIAERNASSSERQALAALRSADAAVQNAATNDRLADYETSLKYTQELLTWYQAEGQKVISENLPERTRVEIDNLLKEGVKLDAQGRLINRQGHLVTAQTVKTYVNVGTDISGAVNQWLNPFSKGPGSSTQPGFDLSGAYQGVAYGYD